MKEIYKKIILYSIAILFLTIVTLTIIIGGGNYVDIFWVCHLFMILVPIGIFFKKINLVLSQLAIILIPGLLWTMDFIINLISKVSPFGLTDYILMNGRFIFSNVLALHHLIIIPLTIIAILLMKPKKINNFLIIALAEVLILFLLSLAFPPFNGINCLPNPDACTSMNFSSIIPYSIILVAIMYIFIIISYLAIKNILKKY